MYTCCCQASIWGGSHYSDSRYSGISKWVMQWVRDRVRARVRIGVRVRVKDTVRLELVLGTVGIGSVGIGTCTQYMSTGGRK